MLGVIPMLITQESLCQADLRIHLHAQLVLLWSFFHIFTGSITYQDDDNDSNIGVGLRILQAALHFIHWKSPSWLTSSSIVKTIGKYRLLFFFPNNLSKLTWRWIYTAYVNCLSEQFHFLMWSGMRRFRRSAGAPASSAQGTGSERDACCGKG